MGTYTMYPKHEGVSVGENCWEPQILNAIFSLVSAKGLS